MAAENKDQIKVNLIMKIRDTTDFATFLISIKLGDIQQKYI